MDMDSVIADVASAVGLAGGPSAVGAAGGVARGRSGGGTCLGATPRREPVAVREVSRMAELPVPIVAAVCNELRRRGVVDRARPVRLTTTGRELLGAYHADLR